MLGASGIVAIGFDELDVLARAGAGDLDKDAASLTDHIAIAAGHQKYKTSHYTDVGNETLCRCYFGLRRLRWRLTVELGWAQSKSGLAHAKIDGCLDLDLNGASSNLCMQRCVASDITLAYSPRNPN